MWSFDEEVVNLSFQTAFKQQFDLNLLCKGSIEMIYKSSFFFDDCCLQSLQCPLNVLFF